MSELRIEFNTSRYTVGAKLDKSPTQVPGEAGQEFHTGTLRKFCLKDLVRANPARPCLKGRFLPTQLQGMPVECQHKLERSLSTAGPTT